MTRFEKQLHAKCGCSSRMRCLSFGAGRVTNDRWKPRRWWQSAIGTGATAARIVRPGDDQCSTRAAERRRRRSEPGMAQQGAAALRADDEVGGSADCWGVSVRNTGNSRRPARACAASTRRQRVAILATITTYVTTWSTSRFRARWCRRASNTRIGATASAARYAGLRANRSVKSIAGSVPRWKHGLRRRSNASGRGPIT